MAEVNITNLLHLGIKAYEDQNYSLAESYLLDIIYIIDEPDDPHFIRAIYALAMNYLAQGNETGASRCFEQARNTQVSTDSRAEQIKEEGTMIRSMLDSFIEAEKWEVAHFLVQQEEAYRESRLPQDWLGWASLYRLGALVTSNLGLTVQEERYLTRYKEALDEAKKANELSEETYSQFLDEIEKR